MKKSERPKASKCEDGLDFISIMPDAVLLLILARLPSTEEAIRSSTLSKRWRYLWTAVPKIDIRDGGKLKQSEFKEFMYWVLSNKSVDLDRFNLHCSVYESMSTVGRWIHAAVTKNVKQLSLSFFCKEFICNKEFFRKKRLADIEVPNCLVSCGSLEVLELDLSQRGLRLPNSMGFSALRVLDFSYVDLLEDDDLVNDFLERCPLLEDLTLSDCSINKLNLLRISCQNLKKLSIDNLDNTITNGGLCGSIQVSCQKLAHLDITGWVAYNYIFECLDSLKEACIEPRLEGNTKSVLFPGISHTQSLLIDFSFFSQCIKAARDPGIPNLKTLVLTTTIDAFSFDEFIRILKYYLKLESLKLVIKEEFYGSEEWELHEGDASALLTSDLKRVEIFEFNGEKPKIASDWGDISPLEMVFSWGKKVTFYY